MPCLGGDGRRMTGALAELMSPTALIMGDPGDRVLRVRFGAEESSYRRNRAGQNRGSRD
jgi:hypothetical protein